MVHKTTQTIASFAYLRRWTESAVKIEQLRDAGYETVSDLQEADQDELTTVDGIGEAVATRIIAEVAENDSSDDENDSGLGELFG